LELFLTPLQFVYLFCNLPKCILLFFSRTSFIIILKINYNTFLVILGKGT
jgi:hypothetical protein